MDSICINSRRYLHINCGLAAIIFLSLYFAIGKILSYYLFLKRNTYIHRVGRTTRDQGDEGHALIFLRPEELGFLPYL